MDHSYGPSDTRRPARPVRRVGLLEEPPALRLLIAFSASLMLTAVIVGLVIARRQGVFPEPPYWVVAAAGAVALSQLAMLRLRTTGGAFYAGWGEAAVIVCLYAVPAAWVPATVWAGTVVAQAIRFASGRTVSLANAIRNTSSRTVGATLGALVAAAIATTYHARISPISALAFCAAAVPYFLVTAGCAAAGPAARGQARFWTEFRQILRNKLIMVVGNVAVGLGVVAILGADWRWILLLPPVLWLLQQSYGHGLRGDDERRTWQAFAGATKSLNQLEERQVAMAGVDGAMTLFSPWRAEVAVLGADGPRQRYVAHRGGAVTEIPAVGEDTSAGASVAVGDDDPDASRPLLVGGVQVGELRLWFDDRVRLTSRQHDAFSAFGDALAAALHDAATHRELQVITARSSHDAAHDPLTGLPNRATVLARGDATLRLLDRDAEVALLLLDIDHFKEVNDTLGHSAGDELLRTTAARLDALILPGELLARLGGDEFALLLPALPDEVAPGPAADRPVRAAPPAWPGTSALSLRQALRRARQLAEHLATPTEVAGVQLSIEASVGVVVAPAGSADMSELLRRAYIAMYQAKRGGPSIAWYDSAKDAASTDRLALLAEMREALATPGQIHLALQPAVDLTTGSPTGVEALVRWQHPRRGALYPVDFVRAVEASELLGPFTRHVIDLALTHAAEWAAQGLAVPVAVNMSARSLLDPRLPADVAELLRQHRVPAHRLVLEITETVVMSELEVIDEVLAGLRELGVQLAVDDFGTGYSSLTFLTRIAVDEVKVDRAFVAKMVDSPEAAAIVRTTVDLGKELGLRVVAEGVETDEQRKLLSAMGCSAAQGFLFFHPMPAEKIGGVLRSLFASAQARVIPLRSDDAS